MGKGRCSGDHDFAVTKLGAGLARLECRRCDTAVVDLDAAGDGERAVTTPGLFRPKRATIFSVLAEEQRVSERRERTERNEEPEPSKPKFAFGGAVRRRR